MVEGLRAGGHRSPFHGFSADFQQHRSYRAGDDLKHLDWKILARTDRLYTKRFRETTSLGAMLVLDTSASMDYPAGGLTKFRYAQIVAASLAYLIAGQGDAVGLMSSSGQRLTYLPAKGGPHHLRSVIAAIDRLTPSGDWKPTSVISRAAELLKRRGAVLVISDFYDDEEPTQRELRRATIRGHDVSILHVISPDELDFPFSGNLELEALESGERRTVDGSSVAAEYRQSIRSFLDSCERQSRKDGVDYALFRTDVSPERALRNYLLRRESSGSALRQTR